MNKLWMQAGLAAVLSLAAAADVRATAGAGIRLGTTGIGAEGAVELVEDYLNLRVAGNAGTLSVEVNGDDIDYDSDFDLNLWMAVLDWHAGGGPFKVVFGICYNGNSLEGTARPTEPVEIGDVEFTPAQIGTLRATADWSTLGGYLGIGFGNLARTGGRWTASLDLGVMVTAMPDLDLESRGGTLSASPLVQREIEKELDNFEDDSEPWLQFYPVLSIGLAMRF